MLPDRPLLPAMLPLRRLSDIDLSELIEPLCPERIEPELIELELEPRFVPIVPELELWPELIVPVLGAPRSVLVAPELELWPELEGVEFAPELIVPAGLELRPELSLRGPDMEPLVVLDRESGASCVVEPGAPRFVSVAEVAGCAGRFWLTVVSRLPDEDCATAPGMATARIAAAATPARRCFIELALSSCG